MIYLINLEQFIEGICTERSRFLSNIQMFKDFSKKTLETFSSRLNKIKLQQNQIIFQENDPYNNIYFILNGEVEVSYININIFTLLLL